MDTLHQIIKSNWPTPVYWALSIVGLCFIILRMYVNFVQPLSYFKNLGVKGPPPKLFLGNILDLAHAETALINNRCKYGKIHGSFFGRTPMLWVGDPEIVKTIMVKEFANFCDRVLFIRKDDFPMGLSVLMATGEQWKRIRNVLITTFSASKLKQVSPIINDICDKTVEKLIIAAEGQKFVNMLTICGEITMKVIMGTAFGVQVDTDARGARLIESARTLFKYGPLVRLFYIIAPILDPLIRFITVPRAKAVTYLINTVSEVICERRERMKKGLPCRHDLIQIMIEANESGKLTDEEIIAQSFIFLNAGYETTANALSFATYALATHPSVQQKLIAEIDDNYQSNDIVDYDSVSKLPYLDMVFRETLRLYPPVYAATRNVINDTVIDGIKITKEVIVAIPIHSIHHDPDYWPDPEEFIPERFTSEAKKSRHPYCYLPFGQGPRNCVGMRLALIEAKIALAKMLQKVEFVIVNETEIPIKLIARSTLKPCNGISLGIKKRY